MSLAISVALQGVKKGQSPFGACIVKDEKIIAISHNKVWKNTDIIAHAEIQALKLACKKLKTINLTNCVIYSTCEPCPMCFSACHWARISKVVFGTRIKDAKKCGFSELYISNKKMKTLGKSNLKIVEGFMRKESLVPFKI